MIHCSGCGCDLSFCTKVRLVNCVDEWYMLMWIFKLQDPKGQIQKKAYKVLSVILKVLLSLPLSFHARLGQVY